MMRGIELFEQIKKNPNVKSILESIKGRNVESKQGNVYEKIWDLVIKFGCCSILQNDIYENYQGNINIGKLKKVENLELYLNKLKIYSKGEGGKSDITLYNKKSDKWIFMSSKYFLDDNKKDIEDFDVQHILGINKIYDYKYKTIEIHLLVNNKEKVLNIIKKSQKTNNYITDNIHNIMDINDLEIYFQILKKSIQDIDIADINDVFNNRQIPLLLRFHQDLITYKMINQIDKGEINFLLGAKCRSGKTYCVGGLFIKYVKKYAILNSLVITPAPNETLTQFTDELFHKYRDFNNINIIEINNSTELKNIVLQENNIIIISKQLIDEYVDDKTIQSIKQLNLNFIVFDENHFHGTTDMAKNIINSYSTDKTIHLYLSGTFNKPLKEWCINKDNQFHWDVEDEQICKNRDIDSLVEKHGDDVHLFLNDSNIEQQLTVYDKMPHFEILTNMMDNERYNAIKERIKDTSYGFSNSTLLCGNFPSEVDMLLRYITGSDKEIDYPTGDLSIFNRIRQKSIKYNSRTLLNNVDFSTQIWFLPYGPGMTIKKVSEHLKERMCANTILNRYEIKIVNCSPEYKCRDIKADIEKWELKAKKSSKNGLILLAGNQLTLGITLPFCDVVFLFTDKITADVIIQMMYRCMTEYSNEPNEINNKPKQFGFVVDMNISRVLNTLSDFKIYKTDLNMKQKFKYIIENNLINIDSDLFEGKENKTKLVEKLLSIWKENPVNHLQTLLKRIEEMVIEMDTPDQRMINNYFTENLGNKPINIKVKFDECEQEELQTGKTISREPSEINSDIDEKDQPVNISLTKDILPFIIPLSCILTMNTDDNDILQMLNIIKSDETLLEVFNNQSLIWWNQPEIIDMVQKILQKYIYSYTDSESNSIKFVEKTSTIYNISIQIKMSLKALINKPKELLEFINNALKPKQKERQENGEVFTPITLIEELLDNLDKQYIEENGKSIFTEKDFKWGDIVGSGIGNFSVILFLRLMDGLIEQIPDENKRKKHILEKMIYMAELNKKNVHICKQIFNLNYKLNIYQGDALLLDPNKEWGVNKFDVILGNPPYNKGGIKSSSRKLLSTTGDKNETIWQKFVEKSFKILKPNGYLVFIHPLSWLRKSHSVHYMLLEKYIIWMKLWDNSKSKQQINAIIPISLYVLQNKLNIDKTKTNIISELHTKKITTKSFVYLDKKYSIPLAYHSIFNKLIKFIEKNDCKLQVNTKTVKSSGVKQPLPHNYTIYDKWGVDTFRLKDGIIVKKMIEEHPDTNKEKLIVANKNSINGVFIDEGKLGLTGNDKVYILGDNLQLIKKLLSFKLAHMICQYTKYRQDFLDSEAFTFIPDLRKNGYTNITEYEFYDLIGFTKNEINDIKNIIITYDENNKTVSKRDSIILNKKTLKNRKL